MTIDCRACRERLQGWLDGTLSAAERRSTQSHLDDCSDCGELSTLMRLDLPGDIAAPDLAAGVLAATSGSACVRAREILCGYVDGTLETVTTNLLARHLDDCDECPALARALLVLQQDLPSMATIDPGREFFEHVLAATSARRRPWAELGERLARSWAGLLQRPRIAWETGYVGAMGLWLVLSVSGAPFVASPPELRSFDGPTKLVDQVTSRVSVFSREAWTTTADRSQGAWHGIKSGLSDGYRSTAATTEELQLHGARLGQAAVKQGGERLNAIQDELSNLWHRLATRPESPDTTDE